MWEYNYGPNSTKLDEELTHYGVLGMKWGKHNGVRTYTKEPEGGSLRLQGNIIRSKNAVKKAKTKNDKVKAKNQLKTDKQKLKAGFKEYQQFEKSMHQKVGKTSKIKTEVSGGQIKTLNKKGVELKDYEIKGAMMYENSRKLKRYKNQKITSAVITTLAIGGLMYLNNQ